MKLLNLILLCFTITSMQAQWKWINPENAGFPVVQNQGWTNESKDMYARLPDRLINSVRGPVWELSKNSAGLAIYFYSDAPEIQVRYQVNGGLNMPHMPSTGVSGVDLYSINPHGKWNICYGGYSFNDTIVYNYRNGIQPDHGKGYEYKLYLPLYNSVKWLEIGIPEEKSLEFIPQIDEKPIILYGTSIAQGACASRPGMAWGTIVQRAIDHPIINLGFSGNGRLEKPILDLIANTDAKAYILDCIPNLPDNDPQQTYDLTVAAVHQIREKNQTPILLIEHVGCSNMNMDTMYHRAIACKNQESRKAYETLLDEGIKNLYYLSREDLHFPEDGWVDYVHPSDYGMHAQAVEVEQKIREILNEPLGNISTTQPVTQRREPGIYEWLKRHQAILALNKQNAPRAVIIGNSITNYWGGEPNASIKNGENSWNTIMKPAGFHNLGYGWDKIENVLWRVYHGELDGYNAENIVLMIGSNNLGSNNDEEIVEGLKFLLSAIQKRQPDASIKVMGILPRRNDEARVKNINILIKKMAEKEGYTFCDVGYLLLLKNGKLNETLFTDGLHPNTKGYDLIAPLIAK